MLEVQDLSLSIGNLLILRGISLRAEQGRILSIIGPNGAGKTSLLNCLNGFYRPTSGEIHFCGTNITRVRPDRVARMGVARTFQNIEVFPQLTVTENVLVGRFIHVKYNPLQAALFSRSVRKEEMAHWRRVEEVMEFLEMQELRDEPIGVLPYGTRKKVELARALAMDPRLLLLDEPIAGMTQQEKQDMVRYIDELNCQQGMTVILIDHDMQAVMDISHHVCVLDHGEKIAEGTPAEVQANPLVIQAYLGADMGRAAEVVAAHV